MQTRKEMPDRGQCVSVCVQHACESIGRVHVRSLLTPEEVLPSVTLRLHVQPLRYFLLSLGRTA